MRNRETALDPQTTLALPLDGIKLIEASAGTGKTYTIGNLYLRYILSGRKVSEILVVTFTNAATEELRGRIRERLHQTLKLIQDPQPANDRFLETLQQQIDMEGNQELVVNYLKLAVRSMDEAAIYTIHGFCQRALSDYAFNSGQTFDMELATNDTDLWNEALKDWWRKTAYGLSRQDVLLFNNSLCSIENFTRFQAPLRQAHDKTLLPVTEDDLDAVFSRWHALKENLSSVAGIWQQRREEIITILQNSAALSRAKTLEYHKDNLADFLNRMGAYFLSDNLLEIPGDFKALSAQYLYDNSKKTKRDTDPDLRDAFFIDCKKIIDQQKTLQRDFRVAALKEATHYASEHVEQIKQQSQTIAFHDQLTRLYDGLYGSQGEDLADKLRQRFPVAMIDEFQDTDAIQYGIFHKLYHNNPNTSLIMIGDPKQAIYSFRGGDIFTYMRAKADADQSRYTLDTNWRSVPNLIGAVNSIFTFRAKPFIYADAIDYQAVKSATEEEKQKPHALLLEKEQPVAPLTLWKIPLNDNGKPQSKGVAEDTLAKTTAGEIARLIHGGSDGSIMIGEKPVVPGDIAVLVRAGYEGARVRQELQAYNINAVTVGRDKVFESEESSGLTLLLEAILNYYDRGSARNALSSNLLGLTYTDVARIQFDEEKWLEWIDDLKEFNRLWQHKGFMTMFQAMLQHLGIGQRIAMSDLAERRLTNLLHLAELLQQASKIHPGMDALLGWFKQQAENGDDEEAELRLESDEELVKIVTIHSSKGLEYPIVFLPFLWGCHPRKTGGGLLDFHGNNLQAFLDAGSDEIKAHLKLAEKERLAEDIRLAYVALTRAKAKVYLAWGRVNLSDKTAMAYLLHEEQTPEELEHTLPNAFIANRSVDSDLERLVEKADETIELSELPEIDGSVIQVRGKAQPITWEPKQFKGKIATDWHVTSFSGMTRDIHQTAHGGSPRSTDDAVLNFPAGSHVGSFLHLILEHLDFQNDIETQAFELTKQLAPRFNIDSERYRETIAQWMNNIVATPLNQQGLSLRDIALEKRLNELEFDFSIHHVDIPALNRTLEQVAGQSLAKMEIDNFRGILTGIIDLVFEHNGKFYVADYKSNFLGGVLEDYRPENLRQAVLDRRYDLQYLLYTLALHRYLKQRLDDYCYDQHFGGIYYLFLRGMRPQTGPAYGVFHELPDKKLIETLDQQIFTTAMAGVAP